MQCLRPALVVLLAPLAVGCELENYAPLVPLASVDHPAEPLAVTANGDHVWLTDTADPPPWTGPKRLVLADAHDGTILDTIGPFTDDWAVVDVATEYELGSRDDIWVLHQNGWRTRWSPQGQINQWDPPVPNDIYPAIWRTHCGFTRDHENGYTFITAHEWTLEGYKSMLYRYRDGQWAREPIEGPDCQEITFDLVAKEVVVYHVLWNEVQWRDRETMALQHEVVLPEPYDDVVAFDRMTALSTTGRIDLYDETGSLLDTMNDVGRGGLHVHYGDLMLRLYFSAITPQAGGPDAYAVGSWELAMPE